MMNGNATGTGTLVCDQGHDVKQFIWEKGYDGPNLGIVNGSTITGKTGWVNVTLAYTVVAS
jgi:hypothetical protein